MDVYMYINLKAKELWSMGEYGGINDENLWSAKGTMTEKSCDVIKINQLDKQTSKWMRCSKNH